MHLYAALQKSNLTEKFKAYATPERSSADVLAWCKRQPELAGCHFPGTVRDIRRKLKCQAAAGGKRETRGQPFMSIRSGGRKVCQS